LACSSTFAAGLKYPYGRTTEGSSQPDQIHPEHTTNHQGDEDDQCHQTAEGPGSYSADAAVFQKASAGAWQYRQQRKRGHEFIPVNHKAR